MTKISWVFVWILIVFSLAARAATPEDDARALLRQTGVRGGLCLVIGFASLDFPFELAKQSGFYVQILDPNPKRAWSRGLELAESRFREKMALRNAAFVPSHYGSRLFNLIVVGDSVSPGKATMADLERILVPQGVVAMRRLPPGCESEASACGMAPVAVDGFAGAFRKRAKPVEWRLPLALKWRAGPRSQIANGFVGVAAADGKLFYLEQMERNTGDLRDSAARLFARDAYNGRTLWTWEAPGGWNRYNDLAATRDGRVFVRTGDRKVLRLDGASGKVLSEVVSKVGRETRIRLLNDDLLYVGGDVYATKTGRLLWKFPRLRYQPMRGTIVGDRIFFCDGKTLEARNLADGAPLWKRALELPRPCLFGGGSGWTGWGRTSAWMERVGDRLLIRMRGNAKDACSFAILDPANGKILWTYVWKVRISPNEKYFDAKDVKFVVLDGRLILYYRHNQPDSYADEIVVTRLDLADGKEEIKDRVLRNAGDFHGCFKEIRLGDFIAYYDLWFNLRTLTTTLVSMPHPACFFGSKSAYGLVYDFPSRKSGPITAVGPEDPGLAAAPQSPSPALETFAEPGTTEATRADDWPMFRGGPSGGNSCSADMGAGLKKSWEAPVGLGGKDFGVMSSRRTGLTQAVIGYGLAVVGDIDGQRIVALDVESGRRRWVFPVGSRVDYPPTLYKGRCLFAARDGWVRCLDVKTGALLWRLRVPERERYIGGWEKLESRWPVTSDVLVANGMAYVAGGEADGVAFDPEIGKVLDAENPGRIALGEASLPGGRQLTFSYDVVIKGNSIPRTNEDNWRGFRLRRFGRRLDARVLAFDDTMTVAFKFEPSGEGWANKGELYLMAVDKDPAKPVWKSPPIELVVDDILLTPELVYCVGHYQRIKKDPELWVLSRKDGRVIGTLPVGGFPAFLGMSSARNRLFVATRDGRLICFKGGMFRE